MDINGHTYNLGSGVVGFVEEFGVKDVVKVANKLSKMDKFKRILVRRVSERGWGIETVFAREKDYNKSALEELLIIIEKIVGKNKINCWDVSGEIIQIKPKIIR